MRILRLRAVNFRRFDDIDLSFSEGLNLVRGPNESGKSTMVMAVMAGLFARPQTNTALGRSYLRWGTDEAPLIELDFIHGGVRYRMVKDFAEHSVSLEEEGGAPLRSLKAVDAKVFELIGFGDPAKYLRTACVTHDQMVSLAEDSTGARKLANMLREVVVGGRESSMMESAAKKLTSEADDLKRGLERPTGNPGIIKRLVDEREALINRQKELTKGLSDLEVQRERLKEVERLLEKQEPRLDELDDFLARNRRVDEFQRRASQARDRFVIADRVIDARRELQRTDNKIRKGFSEFDDLEPGADSELRKAIEMRRSLVEMREGLSRAPSAAEAGGKGSAARPAARPPAWWVAMSAGALVVLAGIILGLVQPALFSVIAVGLAIIIAAASSLGRPAAPAPQEVPKMLDEQVRRADGEIARLEALERELLRSAGCDDAEEFFAAHHTYLELLSDRDRDAAGLSALLGGRSFELVEEDRRQASLDAAACEEILLELKPFRVEPERLGVLARERDGMAEAVAGLKKERDGLTFHLMRSPADPEEAARIEEEVSWLWEAEQAARRRLRIYTRARDAMKETATSMLSSAVPVLSESVGRTLSSLTGGRYDRVEVRESDLAISVYSAEKGGFLPPDELMGSLSKGATSQLYLAARLELVELLSGGRKPPLIFDDSFSYFDESRLEFLWDILLDVARGQQVIVLTCTDRYDRLASSGVNILDLDQQ